MTKISSSNNDLIRYIPTGVTILGILFVIAGAFTLLGGIATLVAIPFVSNVNPNVINDELQLNGQQPLLTPSEQTALAQGSGSILTVLGAILIPLGIASLVVAYGLFKGKSWAWLVAVVLSTIGIIVNAISLVTANMSAITGALVGIAINAIVLYYLSRRNVREYFGKVAAAKETSSTTV
ncbi:MAG TPA: DUF2127 domain-containing protein [Nitrososphaeraceae archaeon]|jgi:uncharacterized membrane protein (DUF2068 family)|nr:DUF2127 domain-containing protein [Nitrososphaeraceae archaeon]